MTTTTTSQYDNPTASHKAIPAGVYYGKPGEFHLFLQSAASATLRDRESELCAYLREHMAASWDDGSFDVLTCEIEAIRFSLASRFPV